MAGRRSRQGDPRREVPGGGQLLVPALRQVYTIRGVPDRSLRRDGVVAAQLSGQLPAEWTEDPHRQVMKEAPLEMKGGGLPPPDADSFAPRPRQRPEHDHVLSLPKQRPTHTPRLGGDVGQGDLLTNKRCGEHTKQAVLTHMGRVTAV